MPYSAERYRYHWGAMLITVVSEQMDTVSNELELANVVCGHEQLVKSILQ